MSGRQALVVYLLAPLGVTLAIAGVVLLLTRRETRGGTYPVLRSSPIPGRDRPAADGLAEASAGQPRGATDPHTGATTQQSPTARATPADPVLGMEDAP
jgi:hypothetical protein